MNEAISFFHDFDPTVKRFAWITCNAVGDLNGLVRYLFDAQSEYNELDDQDAFILNRISDLLNEVDSLAEKLKANAPQAQ